MSKRFIHISIILCMVIYLPAWGQSGVDSTYQAMMVKLDILEFVREYQRDNKYNDPDSNQDREKLRQRLIDPDTVKLLNDVLPANNLNQRVLWKEYDNAHYNLYTGDPLFDVFVYRIELEKMLGDGISQWEVDAYKVISDAISKNGNNYRDTLNVRFTLVHNPNDSIYVVRILRLESLEKRGKYVILQAKDETLNTISINNKEQPLRYGKHIIKDVKPGEKLKLNTKGDHYFGKTVVINDNIGADDENQSNTVLINFRKKRFYLLPSLAAVSGNSTYLFAKDPTGGEGISVNYNGWQPGIAIGWQIVAKPKFTLAIESGLQQLRLDYSATTNEITTTPGLEDNYGVVYSKVVAVKGTESGTFSGFLLPLQIRVEYKVLKKLGVFVGGGYILNVGGDIEYQTEATANYAGKYEKYTIDTDVGELGFGSKEHNTTTMANWSSNFSLMRAQAGLSFKLNQRFYLEGAVAYTQSLNAPLPLENVLSESKEKINSVWQSENAILNPWGYMLALKIYL